MHSRSERLQSLHCYEPPGGTREPDIDPGQFFINARNRGCRSPLPAKFFGYPNAGELRDGRPQGAMVSLDWYQGFIDSLALVLGGQLC
jgi:hypothetical protein